MSKKLVIVIPGLGDESSVSKIRAITKRWGSDYDVSFFDSRWETNESFKNKKSRLNKLAKQYSGDKLSVVAYSAGGALAMSLYELDIEINKIILISCKLKRPEGIGPKYQKLAPALVQTVQSSELIVDNLSNAEKTKAICLRPLYDGVVDRQDMIISDVNNKLIPFVGHAASIGFAMLFQVKKIV